MSKPGPWTQSEFATLAKGNTLSHDDVAAATGRSKGAVDVVRQGICQYHGGNRTTTLLSQLQKDYLDASRGALTCWRCGNTI